MTEDPPRGPARRQILAAAVAGALAVPVVTACSRQVAPSGVGPSEVGPPTGASPSPSGTVAASSVPTTPTAPGRNAAAGADIAHGPAGVDKVALTFHGAGDAGLLDRMLTELAAGGARVTVLAIGQWLAGEPALARTILDGGHELGNHTWSHRTMPRLPSTEIVTEVNRAAAELRRLTGGPGRWFRPSGTPRSTPAIRSAAVAAGYGACLGYDVDPLDYTDPGAPAITARLVATIRPGSIVSLHLGHPGTVQAMPQILDQLRSRGLAAVTASELLGHG